MSNNNYYSKKYIPSITKWGKGTLLLGIVLCFAPLIVVSGIFGYMPPIAAIIAGTISQISVSGAFYIVEPIAYFPILGIPGTYMTFISGNTSNMRVPCAMVAQEAADVEPGTEKGSVISTIGIAVSIIVNIIILSVGVVFGQAILSVLPPQVTVAFDLILPALFGAVFGQFAIMKPKFAAVAALIAVPMNFLLKNGVFDFMPGSGSPSYLVILTAVFGTILIGKKINEKEEAKQNNRAA